MAGPTSALQINRFVIEKLSTTEGRATVVFRTRPVDGPAIEWPYVLPLDFTGPIDLYGALKNAQDDIQTDLEGAPYLLEFPDPPVGKIRSGWPEDAP